jgi:thiol-disulfide isomerase/thioredoxin
VTAGLLALLAALAVAPGTALGGEEPAPAGVAFEPGTPPFADVLAKAKAEGKPAFLDFATEWCGWCKRLEADVFSRPEVGKVMRGFVAVHVDAEKGEGPALAKRFGVRGFPTLVVVDASGDEVDRIVGYLAAEPFTAEARRILSGEGTIPALRKRVADAPDDLAAGIALGAKVAVGNPEEAARLFEELAGRAKDADRPTQGRVRLEHAAALLAARRTEEAVRAAETLVQEFPDTPAAAEAAARVGRAFLSADPRRALTFLDAARGLAKEPAERRLVETLALQVHRTAAAAALRRQALAAGDDPMALNEVAWAAFEQKLAVRDAVGWARRAVDASKRDPMVLDTLANLLFLEGAREEAVALEGEAVEKAEGELRGELSVVLARMRAEVEARAAAKAAPAKRPAPAPSAPPVDEKPADGASR